MNTYTVTIGRNVADLPMPELEWDTFIDCVQEVLAAVTDDSAIETHLGTGIWDGVVEESAKVTLLTDTKLKEYEEGYLVLNFQRLARQFHQDAIAYTVGESTLITPSSGHCHANHTVDCGV